MSVMLLESFTPSISGTSGFQLTGQILAASVGVCAVLHAIWIMERRGELIVENVLSPTWKWAKSTAASLLLYS